MTLGLNSLTKTLFSWFLFLILGLVTSCGGIQKAAVKTTGSLIYSASGEVETEKNWQFFKEGVPANLKFMEGLAFVDSENQDLLVGLVKGYTGYGYGVSETLLLEEKLKGIDKGDYYYQALAHYSKAIDYALSYLAQEDIHFKDLQKAVRTDEGVAKVLNDKLSVSSERDLELVAFFAQALGAVINLQRDQMTMVAQLPVAKGLFDWVCELRPDINHGACAIFYGAYAAGRPKTLGGDPEKGEAIFKKAIKDYPHNWLVRLSYVQFVLIPKLDKKSYLEQKEVMKDWAQLMRENQVWSPLNKTHEDFENKQLGVYQSLALKRFEIIQKYETEIFN